MGVFSPLLYSNFIFDYVVSGCVWSGDSYGASLNGSMTSGTVLVNGQYVSLSAVTAHAFTASKDTYIDVSSAGVLVYTEVTNNAASPALAANSIRLGIIVTAAGSIAAATSVNQGQETIVLPIASSTAYTVTDSLGNLICPRDSNRKLLGYRQVIASQTVNSVSETDVTGVASPVIVPSGRKIKITAMLAMASSGATGVGTLSIKEGATGLNSFPTFIANTANVFSALNSYVTTPTAGLHTYKISGILPSATSQFFGDSVHINFIRIELE